MKHVGVTASVREIAAEAGVSIATVSRVLNGQANVAAHTRELVRVATERLNGRPRIYRHGTKAVYVRCPYILTDYFGLIVSSIAENLDQRGLQLVLNAGEPAQTSHPLRDLPGQAGLGGAIMILPPEETDEIIALADRGFPFVVVDPRTPLPSEIAAVSANHFSGAHQMTRHLVELGHRRIGVIAGPSEWMASNARLAGHNAALVEVGVLSHPALIRFVHPTIEDGYRAARELLEQAEPPTALVGFNDKIAVGALQAAAERGLRVPEDLSVTGFDDIELARATHPMLTTVSQPLREMGRMAVSQLMRLQERHRLDVVHVDLATKLVIRRSTGPVPRQAAASR
jgi:LacI family transcriptional regulator